MAEPNQQNNGQNNNQNKGGNNNQKGGSKPNISSNMVWEPTSNTTIRDGIRSGIGVGLGSIAAAVVGSLGCKLFDIVTGLITKKPAAPMLDHSGNCSAPTALTGQDLSKQMHSLFNTNEDEAVRVAEGILKRAKRLPAVIEQPKD